MTDGSIITLTILPNAYKSIRKIFIMKKEILLNLCAILDNKRVTTIGELSYMTGIYTQKLFYYVKTLQKYGIVELKKERITTIVMLKDYEYCQRLFQIPDSFTVSF
ncbi:hypothetical protein [Sulfolobus ellipsoid virus 1]|uniref:Uncharacterized protein n=1 Tax=Sulfolobus ellipsoid virus 1 TaxID=2056194 RepID=A0A2H4RBP9_9VIRU|nr:hypothetical protein FGG62_gp28 [Sulfolobus ellipsoid virus 1]ATY46506.1 hypothetical protein [Sulfolobus ellipsoid virus 1]